MQQIMIAFPGLGQYSRDWLDAHPEEAQRLLALCKGQYPQCQCKQPGQPLYIAHRRTYYLARLPHTGPQHHPACPSYEPDPSLCGRGIYSHKALQEDLNGHLNIKLGVPLQIRATRAGAISPASVQGGVQRLTRDTIELRGLLHLLVERARFNRWRPGMLHRRRYRQFYKFVLQSAEAVSTRNEPLSDHLWMPEPFDPERTLEIEAHRQRALRERSQSSGGAPLRVLVLGQIRSILPAGQPGGGLALAHLPKQFIIRAEAAALAKLRLSNEFAWVDWPELVPGLRLIVLLTMQRSREGHWTAAEIASLITTSEYIPVFSLEEALLVRRLVSDNRVFYKPLPYDSLPARFPNFLLGDVGDSSTPLEVLPTDPAEAAARQVRIGQYQEDSRPHWVWNVQESALPPALPEVIAHGASREVAPAGPAPRETAEGPERVIAG
jgi:Protein of unknown function (DUF1173)